METDNNNIEQTTELGNEQYIAAINELKTNSVSKDAYKKLQEENQQLLDALVNGKQIEIPSATTPDITELRTKLFNADGELSNLEYVENALALRNALIESGERDPFLPVGDRVALSTQQIDAADRVATVLQECVDFAQGDSGIFTAELQRRTKDVMPKFRR